MAYLMRFFSTWHKRNVARIRRAVPLVLVVPPSSPSSPAFGLPNLPFDYLRLLLFVFGWAERELLVARPWCGCRISRKRGAEEKRSLVSTDFSVKCACIYVIYGKKYKITLEN